MLSVLRILRRAQRKGLPSTQRVGRHRCLFRRYVQSQKKFSFPKLSLCILSERILALPDLWNHALGSNENSLTCHKILLVGTPHPIVKELRVDVLGADYVRKTIPRHSPPAPECFGIEVAVKNIPPALDQGVNFVIHRTMDLAVSGIVHQQSLFEHFSCQRNIYSSKERVLRRGPLTAGHCSSSR